MSNLALILGIGASGASNATVLLSGLAGLLAGAPRATGVPGARSVRLMVFDPGSGPAVEITCTDGSARRGTVTARPDGSGVAVFAAS